MKIKNAKVRMRGSPSVFHFAFLNFHFAFLCTVSCEARAKACVAAA